MSFVRSRLVAFAVAASAFGCATVDNESRLQTTLQAREFNSIASRYLERPTKVALIDRSDHVQTLTIVTSLYGGRKSYISFFRGRSAEYAAMIDKFTEWELIAKERGDALTKVIGRVPAPANGPVQGELEFRFHSGNPTTHFLVVSFCAVGTCVEDSAIALDGAAAQELKRLLLDFDGGRLKPIPVDAIYK